MRPTLHETKQTLSWINLNNRACQKHTNSEVIKPPSQLRFFAAVNHNYEYIQATNPETQKQTKQIEIHLSQITNRDLLNPIK